MSEVFAIPYKKYLRFLIICSKLCIVFFGFSILALFLAVLPDIFSILDTRLAGIAFRGFILPCIRVGSLFGSIFFTCFVISFLTGELDSVFGKEV